MINWRGKNFRRAWGGTHKRITKDYRSLIDPLDTRKVGVRLEAQFIYPNAGEALECDFTYELLTRATPTPTPTITPTPTLTLTPTPTTTPTPTPSPFVAVVSIAPTGSTQYQEVILTGSTNISSPTYIWSLTGFTDTSGNTISSYTGNPLTEGYFTLTGSSNVELVVIGTNPYGSPVTAITTNFVVSAGFLMMAAGNSSDDFIKSYDGLNWTGGTLSSSQQWQSCAAGNNIWVYGVAQSGSLQRFIYSTDNGDTWSSLVGPTTSSRMVGHGLTYANYLGSFYSAAFQSTTAYYSSDGATWSGYTLPSADFGTIATDEDNNLLLFGETNPSGLERIFTSFSGGSFTERVDTNSRVKTIMRNSTIGLTIAFGESGESYVSTDSINWTANTITGWTSLYPTRVVYSESTGRNLVFEEDTNGNYWISDDGVNWSGYTISNGVRYHPIYSPAIDKFVIVGNKSTSAYSCATSSDGITWTYGTLPQSLDIRDVMGQFTN